jgi:hypothetical protein
MPDVHVPKLDEHEEEEPVPPAAGPVSTPHRRSRSFVKIGLEVVLISAGVFLGLMGEQWRERSEHRELAEESLRRFVQSTIYGQSWTQDLDGAMRSILNYMGDASYFDPRLLTSYDDVLQRIDRALGESPSKELR